MSRVLVTGHLGYIGTVLVPVFLEAGHEVVGLDTDLYAACTFGSPSAIADVPNLGVDVRDVTADQLRGFDAIVHLAALSNDPLSDLDPELTYDINWRATVRLATLAREAGVGRFLFSSSCSNYGAAGGALLDETSALNPVTAYGESKVRAEQELRELASASFTVVSLRNATAYGIAPRLRCDVVLNNLTAWAVSTGRIVLKSDGSPWRPLVHIRDISNAFLAALAAPADAVNGRSFNICSTVDNRQIRDLATVVGSVVPNCTVELSPDASPDTRNYRVNGDLFSSVTGFATEWTVQTGAEEIYAAFAREGMTLEDAEGPRYQRIRQIRARLAAGSLGQDLRPA
jgi:nucleoside-diphosphate-sugar epimerase